MLLARSLRYIFLDGQIQEKRFSVISLPTLDCCNGYNDCCYLNIRIIAQTKETLDMVKNGVRQRTYHTYDYRYLCFVTKFCRLTLKNFV